MVGWRADLMSRSAEVELDFAGEPRRFRFAVAEHRRLQEKLDMGLALIVERLHPYVAASRVKATIEQTLQAKMLGDVRPNEVREVIYQGLVGGGMEPSAAGKLVRDYVDERPVLEPVPVAYAIGLAALVGTEDEDAAGELAGETVAQTGADPSPNASSVSATTVFTRSARPRVSRPAKSTT